MADIETDWMTCKYAEEFGAAVAWANDPEHYHHQITFTPDQLRKLIADLTGTDK